MSVICLMCLIYSRVCLSNSTVHWHTNCWGSHFCAAEIIVFYKYDTFYYYISFHFIWFDSFCCCSWFNKILIGELHHKHILFQYLHFSVSACLCSRLFLCRAIRFFKLHNTEIRNVKSKIKKEVKKTVNTAICVPFLQKHAFVWVFGVMTSQIKTTITTTAISTKSTLTSRINCFLFDSVTHSLTFQWIYKHFLPLWKRRVVQQQFLRSKNKTHRKKCIYL